MGFAILWVMLFHLPGHTGFLAMEFFKSIGYGGVDIFLFLSAFGLYFSMSKGSFDAKQYIKHRFFRIIPEFWIVLLAVFLIQMDFSTDSFRYLACHLFTLDYWIWGKGETWYISCILVFYAVYPAYFKLFKTYGMRIPVIIICLGLAMICTYALTCVLLFNNDNILGALTLTFSRIPIFFVGAVFGHWAKDGVHIQLSRRLIILTLSTTLVSTAALYVFITHFEDYLWTCSLYFVPFILITPVLCILLAICFDKIRIANQFFGYAGTLSLELYLCHEYSYPLFGFFTNIAGKAMAYVLIVSLSVISAVALKAVTSNPLQSLLHNRSLIRNSPSDSSAYNPQQHRVDDCPDNRQDSTR